MANRSIKWLFTALVVMVLSIGIVGIALAQDVSAEHSNQTSADSKIEAGLTAALSTGPADFIVRFVSQPDLSPAYSMAWQERGEYVYNTLTAAAQASQSQAKGLLDNLGLRHQTFIAGNELYVWQGTLEAAQALSVLPRVEYIRATQVYHIDPVSQRFLYDNIAWAADYLQHPIGPQVSSIDGEYDWGILDTKADQFWNTFGFQGSGILVANIDTGVQYDHSALASQYKCQANPTDPSCWYDPSNICEGGMCDNMGHGTHTMGTMVAADDPALPYIAGMAPDAQWIACKGCEYNWCSDFALNSCADWILAPGGNTENRPDIVNNSWGGESCNTWYLNKVNSWRAAGIFPAFSAGNGWGCNTLGSPGDYQESFASTSHNSSRYISNFSSSGPSCFGHDPYTKPNLSAPGENICSSVPGNGWDCYYSGTSMASPHTAGAVALLWSCNPGLVGQIDQTFQILQDNADPSSDDRGCGIPEDGEGNYTYGYGYLDVYQAGLLWCGDNGTLEGHVYDSGTIPLPQSHVYSTPGPFERWTDDDGYYNMVMMTGEYTVTAEAYGYYASSVFVEIVSDTITTQDFHLTQAPTATVSGVVTDYLTGWPLYAYIAITDYPPGGVWTDPVSGFYSVILPEGDSYEFTVTAVGPGYYPAYRTVGPLGDDATEDFTLEADVFTCDAPGYLYDPETVTAYDFEANNGGFALSGVNTTFQWGVPTSGPGSAYSGINVWATNLSGNYNDNEEDYLTSQPIDLSSYAGQTLQVSWWQWLQTESCCDWASVEISNDGGNYWQTIYGDVRGDVDLSWAQHVITIDSSFAVSNFKLRFHFYTDGSVTYPGWYIDDVQILAGECTPQEGGLVVGNVRDSNLGTPLTGAVVSNDQGYKALAIATKDPAVDDAFFTLFSSGGWHDFTASHPGYHTVTEAVEVSEGDTVGHDFYLPAGMLVVNPTSLQTNIMLGDIQSVPITLTNVGDGSAAFEIREQNGGMTPVTAGRIMLEPEGEVARSDTQSAFARIQSSPRLALEADVLLIQDWDPWGYPSIPYILGNYSIEYDMINSSQITDWDFSPYVMIIIPSVQGSGYYNSFNNNLAKFEAYIDAGGLLLMSFCTQGESVMIPFGGTNPWDGQNYDFIVEPDHPIFAGVPNPFYGNYASHNSLSGVLPDDLILITTGAYEGGNPVLVEREHGAGMLVAGGLTYEYGWWNGQDAGLILSNMLSYYYFVWPYSRDVPWLSEAPITGTVPAEEYAPIQVIFDTTVLAQPGEYLAQLKVLNDTPYGPLSIPITMSVEPPADWGKLLGSVISLGYCDQAWDPLAEAQVVIESSGGISWTLETGPTGLYSWWLPEEGNPYTVSVTYPEHESGIATGVTIIGQQTIIQDFALRWLEPCMSSAPPALETTLELGFSETLPLTLTNTGAAGTGFEVMERFEGFIPTHIQENQSVNQAIVIPEGQRQVKDTLSLDLPAMPQAMLLAAGDVIQTWTPADNDDAWGIAYDGDNETVWVGDGWTFENMIFEYGSVGTPTGRAWPYLYGPTNGPADGTFNWNTGMIWITAVGDGDCIHEIDPDSGETGNTICPSIPMYAFRGLAYDPSTDTYFGGGWNDQTIYHFDSDGTIIESTYVGLYIAGLAYNPDTMHLFVIVNYWDEPVYVLDVANDYALLGQFYIQGWQNMGNGAGLEIDCEGNLWAVAQGENKVYQLESGESAQLCAKDVSWLTEEPISGTLPADIGVQRVDVTFDAGAVNQPGIYSATLNVKSDDPMFGRLPVAVTMNVTPPPDWGKLTGSVSSLGYCDINPAPLTEYTVVVGVGENPLTATLTAEGAYVVWLEQGTYTVAASAEGHVSTTAEAEITAGEVTTLDFSLRWIAPCISGLPRTYDVEVPQGFSFSYPFSIVNVGAGASMFKLADEAGEGVTAKAISVDVPADKPTGDESNTYAVKQLTRRPDYTYEIPAGTQLSAGEIRVLLLAAADASQIQAILQAYPDLAVVDYYDARNGTPSLEELLEYDNVILISNNWFYDAVAMGDVLADYVDAGGNVIQTVPTFYGYGWALAGRFVDEGYSPFIGVGDWFTWADLSDFDPGHPIMKGVNTASDYYRQMMNMAADAVWVADWTDDEFIATKGKVVAMNTALFDGYMWTGDIPMIVHNSILWMISKPDAPWLTEDPQEGNVEADSAAPVELTFTAFPTMTIDSFYTATLIIKSDDPVSDTYRVPVTMTVITPVIEMSMLPAEIDSSSPPGSVVNYVLDIHNLGNVPDTYAVSVAGGTWPILLPEDEITLAPGESGQVSLFVFIPATAEDGDTDVMMVRATSSLRMTVFATTQVTTRAFYQRVPRLLPPSADGIGKIGKFVDYELTLGNFSVVSDTLVLSTDSIWPVFLSQDRFALDSFEVTTFTVQVFIPYSAAIGDMDLAVITVTSLSDPTARDETKLYTHAEVGHTYLPLVNTLNIPYSYEERRQAPTIDKP